MHEIEAMITEAWKIWTDDGDGLDETQRAITRNQVATAIQVVWYEGVSQEMILTAIAHSLG